MGAARTMTATTPSAAPAGTATTTAAATITTTERRALYRKGEVLSTGVLFASLWISQALSAQSLDWKALVPACSASGSAAHLLRGTQASTAPLASREPSLDVVHDGQQIRDAVHHVVRARGLSILCSRRPRGAA